MVKLRENHINSQETYQQTKKKIVNNRSKHLDFKKMSKKFLNLEEQHDVIRTKMANWQELRSDLEVSRKKLDF